jgi:ribosomal-protein-alanine N-acetyltransferase
MSRRIPALETERLTIRELTLDDLEPINDLLNASFGSETPTDERKRWLQWTVLGYEMFDMLDQPHYGERAVVLGETGEIIGAVGIVPYLDRFKRVAAFCRAPDALATAEVGLFWAIAPAHQRQGYATEATRALVEYLFTQEKLGRLIATTGHGNVPSQKVMRRLGMAVQRVERQGHDPVVVGVLENNRL